MSFDPDMSLVTVIMPAYNHERFVEQAVKSVWDQSYKNIELIVIDDGSKDKTGEILEGLASNSPIKMKVVRKENEGVCKTLNLGLSMAKGEWICFLASDDYYLDSFIETYITASKNLDNMKYVFHADSYSVDESGNELGKVYDMSPVPPASGDSFLSLALGQSRIIATSLFLNRQLVESVGFFDESLVSEDHDYHLRLSHLAEFQFIDQPLLCTRVCAGSLGRSPHKWIGESLTILEKHKSQLGVNYSQAVINKNFRIFTVFANCGDVLAGLPYAWCAFRLAKGLQKYEVAWGLVGTISICFLKKPIVYFNLQSYFRPAKRVINRVFRKKVSNEKLIT